jgi:hypothetical protein
VKRSRRRPSRSAPARVLSRWSTLSLAALAGLLSGFVFFEPVIARVSPKQWTLESFSVVGTRRVAAEELVRASGVAAGTAVSAVDLAAVSERLASHPWVHEARVTTFLPSKLLVAVVEREAAAIVEIGAPAVAWLVDAGGTPFAVAAAVDRELYPTLVGVPDVRPGQANPLLAEGVEIARAVARRDLPAARRVRLGGGDPGALPELQLGPGGRTVVLGGGDLEAKLDRLSWILKADLAELEATSSIDLRFGSQVILRDGPPSSEGEATGARGGAGPSGRGGAG